MIIKQISKIERNIEKPINIWGQVNSDTYMVSLYKPHLGLRFELNVDLNEYSCIADLEFNPEEYSEKLNDKFDKALVEYIKSNI